MFARQMALLRILVDGYSLLHNWPELARGSPRHSAAARDELIARLTQYWDAAGTPITIFFDGSGPRRKPAKAVSPNEIEVLYSSAGQTADDLIERAAYRFAEFGEVLAVTDDLAERETVTSMGGMAMNCANFIQTVESALADLSDEIKAHNRRERQRFGKR
jgi:predicted RNA-binding protein with PIN domain